MENKPSFGNNLTTQESKRKELGALWKKTDKYGNDYFSAKIIIDNKEYNFAFFQNNKKNKPSHPDFRAFERKE